MALYGGVVLLCFIFPSSALNAIFKTPVDISYGELTPPSPTLMSGHSAIECGRLCSERSDCVTFQYVHSNNSCTLSDGTIPATAGTVYGISEGSNGCPSGLGYQLYRKDDIKVCLKIEDTTPADQTTAQNICINDGGHLFLIETYEEWIFAANIFQAKGLGYARVDGKDVLGDNVFKNWKGDTMTYIEWGAPDPSYTAQDCIGLSAVSGYRFRDGFCSGSTGYVCEID